MVLRLAPRAAATALAITVLLAGCSGTPSGGTGHAASTAAGTTTASTTTSNAPAAVRSAVTVAVGRWLGARTPAEACAVTSRGFGQFLGNGSSADCPAHVEQVFGGALQHGPFTVERVVMDDGQAAAVVSVPSVTADAITYWFVQEGTSWRLNSLGEKHQPI